MWDFLGFRSQSFSSVSTFTCQYFCRLFIKKLWWFLIDNIDILLDKKKWITMKLLAAFVVILTITLLPLCESGVPALFAERALAKHKVTIILNKLYSNTIKNCFWLLKFYQAVRSSREGAGVGAGAGDGLWNSNYFFIMINILVTILLNAWFKLFFLVLGSGIETVLGRGIPAGAVAAAGDGAQPASGWTRGFPTSQYTDWTIYVNFWSLIFCNNL